VNQAEGFMPPRPGSSSFCGPANLETKRGWGKKGRSMNRLIHFKEATPLFVVTFVLACFALLPQVRAACQKDCLAGQNTVLGEDALINNTGVDNTANGYETLHNNATGDENTGIGSNALYSNLDGFANTAIGYQALYTNDHGSFNTAIGHQALYSNVAAGSNVAIGYQALYRNTFGTENTAIGQRALINNDDGSQNTANGSGALFDNTQGEDNTANGWDALGDNTIGNNNTGDGYAALAGNTTGSSNVAFGYQAGQNLTTGDNNIDVGNEGVAAESNTIRIGTQGTQTATFIAGVRGAKVMGQAVKVNAAGQIGTAPSSARFKDQIKPMDKASEELFELKPVTFRYKKEIDPDGTPQFGLVAEQVEKVSPDLIVRDRDGKPYSVRYEAVNAMLLNEFLKEHRKVEQQRRKIQEQEKTITQLKQEFQSKFTAQQKQIETLTAGLQKVSAQLEVRRAAPQTVLNDQ
jgi:hypothetical protein